MTVLPGGCRFSNLRKLSNLDYKGCKSCFACQLKNAKTDGVCAIRDGLRPVLEKAREADVIVIGSPVYFSYPTGQTRSFQFTLYRRAKVTKRNAFARFSLLFLLKLHVIHKLFCNFVPVITK